jgi:hypothetical protein
MKVPTYSKYGLKKYVVEQSENKDRKVTELLTHTLPLIFGGILGVIVFLVYFFKSGQSSVFQFISQLLLFGTIGIVCVGIPMAFFILAERLYFRYKKKNDKEYQAVARFNDDRAEYDFWKIRTDEGFWRILDGLSIEKEIINMYMHKGYELKQEFETPDGEHDHVLQTDDDIFYLDVRTNSRLEDTAYLTRLVENKNASGSKRLVIYTKNGFTKTVSDYAEQNSIELITAKDLVKLVKEIGRAKQQEKL